MTNPTWNLAPKPSAWRRVLGVITGILLVLGTIYGVSQQLLSSAQQRQQKLGQQLTQLAPKLQQLHQLTAVQQTLQQRIQGLQQLKQQQVFSPLTPLQDLTKAMIDGIYLTQISVNAAQFMLMGKAVTQIQIQQLRQQLAPHLSLALPLITRDDTTPPYNWSFQLESK